MPHDTETDQPVRGPDLNASKSVLDKKLYRQILLPNGLRCVLIQDTVAMHEAPLRGNYYDVDEEVSEDGSSPVEEKEDEADAKSNGENNSGNDEEEEEDDEDDQSGIRDAAAAVLVGVGSAYDPESCQGLAHFLEHLIFMGSKKYPGENDFSSFISKHGGDENAYTEWESTTYHLSIQQELLFPALDRLAQFFIAPLLLESAVERELLAIESEFQLTKNKDHARWQQLLCSTSHPDHPMAKFAWGNLKSLREIPAELGVDPMKELRTFYDRYYYAANMRLAVIGAYTLDELEDRVAKMFAPVPALPRLAAPFELPINEDQIGSWDATYSSPIAKAGPLLHDHSLAKIYRIVPVKDRHTLMMTWPIPQQMDHWRSKPAEFVAHLLGHEASGSLFARFRKQALAVSCCAGVGDDGSETASSHALFTLSFTLSEKGLQEWRSMVETVYEYIGILRKYSLDGWPEWIYEELYTTHRLSYQYASEESPEDVVEDIVDTMAPHYKLPPERLLDGSALLFDFDPAAVQNILDSRFVPGNCRLDLASSSFGVSADFDDESTLDDGIGKTTITGDLQVSEDTVDFDLKTSDMPPQAEPMFGVRFWCHALQQEWLDRLSELAQPRPPFDDLSLPPQNPFVPVDLDLKPLPENDSRHSLLNSTLKLCIVVGKSKQWFPATVTRYDRKKNAVLVSYEDEEEQWHDLDDDPETFVPDRLSHDFEGTMDRKSIKYRVVALALGSSGSRRMHGDDSDFDVLEGKGFPAIPPAAAPDRLPKSISSSSTLRMWWLQDRHFHRPIAELRMELVCVKANSTPLHRACAELMTSLCVDSLTETCYLAEVCDLFSSFSTTDSGVEMRIHGFNDKLLDLLRLTLGTVLSFRGRESSLPAGVQDERFGACLEVLRRKYRNSDMSSCSLASTIRLEAMRPNIWSVNKKLKAIEDLDVALFAKTMAEIMSEVAVECLYHGNVDRQGAEEAKKLILSLIAQSGPDNGLPRKKYPPHSVLRVPPVDHPIPIVVPSKDPKEPNTAVEVYIQVGKDNLRDRVLIDLLVHMMYEPMYDQIRTRDQFGYDVSVHERWSWGIIGCVFSVVTNVKSADEAVARIDQFLLDFSETIISDDFNEHLIAVAQAKLDMFNSLSEESCSYWAEIRDGRFEWQAWLEEAKEIRTIKKEDAKKAFDNWLLPGKRRSVLVVQVVGDGDSPASTGRPTVDPAGVGDFCDSGVEAFRRACKKQYWGRVNSKLF